MVSEFDIWPCNILRIHIWTYFGIWKLFRTESMLCELGRRDFFFCSLWILSISMVSLRSPLTDQLERSPVYGRCWPSDIHSLLLLSSPQSDLSSVWSGPSLCFPQKTVSLYRCALLYELWWCTSWVSNPSSHQFYPITHRHTHMHTHTRPLQYCNKHILETQCFRWFQQQQHKQVAFVVLT